jgi:hypothetical protein
MFNVPTILGFIAALLLLGGMLSSAKLLYGPPAQRRDRSLASNPAAERSSILLVGSLALSVVAAGWAVVWHFLP